MLGVEVPLCMQVLAFLILGVFLNRLLMQGAGFEEVRVVGSSMLEGWLNNPVHLRAAKSLLDRILQHTHGTSENDFNTVANLLALRVSSTQAPGQVCSSFSEASSPAHAKVNQQMIFQSVYALSSVSTPVAVAYWTKRKWR